LYFLCKILKAELLLGEPVDCTKVGEPGGSDPGKYLQRLSWSLLQSPHQEVSRDWQLGSHKNLPNVGSRAFIRLMDNPENGCVTENQGQSCERHDERKKGTRLLDQGKVD